MNIRWSPRLRPFLVYIGVNVLLFAASLGNPRNLLPYGVSWGGGALRFFLFALERSFLHFGFWHLLMNMGSTFSLGQAFAAVFPARVCNMRYVLGFLFGASLFTGVCVQIGDLLNRHYSAGASGAICALIGFLVAVCLGKTWAARRLNKRGIIGNAVFIVAMTFLVPGISVVGHMSGLVFGLGAGAWFNVRERDA
ncbi:MAG: rhomboid family intramembrane serine protease [Lachnospiraceae bacterium]|nr:rhomboid family intramembrane serine protease [Lachnospiraceae bacterium]